MHVFRGERQIPPPRVIYQRTHIRIRRGCEIVRDGIVSSFGRRHRVRAPGNLSPPQTDTNKCHGQRDQSRGRPSQCRPRNNENQGVRDHEPYHQHTTLRLHIRGSARQGPYIRCRETQAELAAPVHWCFPAYSSPADPPSRPPWPSIPGSMIFVGCVAAERAAYASCSRVGIVSPCPPKREKVRLCLATGTV